MAPVQLVKDKASLSHRGDELSAICMCAILLCKLITKLFTSFYTSVHTINQVRATGSPREMRLRESISCGAAMNTTQIFMHTNYMLGTA